jgi:hypothetical protein
LLDVKRLLTAHATPRMVARAVLQGSARVIRCLQEHRPNLSQACAAALFDHEVWERVRACEAV